MRAAASRNRLIYFRVSEEELERFRSLAELKGARSLSDLAREAMERMHKSQAEEFTQHESVPVLLEQIHCLQDTVNRVHDRIQELSAHFPSLTVELTTEENIGK